MQRLPFFLFLLELNQFEQSGNARFTAKRYRSERKQKPENPNWAGKSALAKPISGRIDTFDIENNTKPENSINWIEYHRLLLLYNEWLLLSRGRLGFLYIFHNSKSSSFHSIFNRPILFCG